MSREVKKYYDENAQKEWERLDNPYSRIEFFSTLHLIEKYFPGNGHILDAGCGPGRYSIELLKKNFQVTLYELSKKALDIAREKIEGLELKANELICSDVRKLDQLPSKQFDGILLMGPLYHIQNQNDRIDVLKKARNLLKNDGVILIAYLNSWGILKAGVTEFWENFSTPQGIQELLDENSFNKEKSFTDVYFSTPPAAKEEVKKAGFEIISYAGAESFLSGISTEVKRLHSEQPGIYSNLLNAAIETCEKPQYRDATEHLHIVARRGE